MGRGGGGGITGAIMNRLWGKERDLRTKGWLFGVIAVGAAGVSSYFTYGFIKRFMLATLLRNVPKKRLSEVEPGEYVRLSGQVTTVHPEPAGGATARVDHNPAEYLRAPKANATCVLLHAVEYRVIEEMATTSTFLNRSRRKGRAAADGMDVTGGGLQYKKDNWKEKQEVVKEVKRSLPCYLLETHGEGPAKGKKDWIQVDLGGEPLYLELETAFEEFKPIERHVEARSSRRTLGYREVEKILPLNAQVLVFGEVSRKSGSDQLIISRPVTRHMFDRKTARTKPWVMTMMSETELLSKVESKARIELYIASGTALLALLTGVYSARNFELLAELTLAAVHPKGTLTHSFS